MAECAVESVVVTNTLAEPLRLSWIAATRDQRQVVPNWARWLPAHQHRAFDVVGADGWIVAERLAWRGVVEESALTYVVRRGANVSTSASTIPSPPPLRESTNSSFVLLISAEQQPFQLCSESPSGADFCHGMLGELGARYIEQLQPRSTLLAFEAVWGTKVGAWQSVDSSNTVRSLRVDRITSLANAPYALAYRAHASSASWPPQHLPEKYSVRFFNHLQQPAILCHSESAATSSGAQQQAVGVLICDAHVQARTATPPRPALPPMGSAWVAYEIVQRVPLSSRSRQFLFGAAPPNAVSQQVPRGRWLIHNPFPYPLTPCESALVSASHSGPPSALVVLEQEAAAAIKARRLECLPTLAPNSTIISDELPDHRYLPRERVLLGLRLVQHLDLETPGTPHEVGLGSGSPGGFAQWIRTQPERARRNSDLSLDSALSDVWGDVAETDADVESKEPPPRMEAEEQCALDFAHDGVWVALRAIRYHWANISAALYTGEVPIEFPPDAIEQGTDADPTRKLLLTKAMLELPHTHPAKIASAACHDNDCKQRLDAQFHFAVDYPELALNATASFRAPLELRSRFFSSPFVFNVECNALLCAYTRVLASTQPYATRQRVFKRKSGHASPFNARKAIEDAFAMVARSVGGSRHATLTEFASGNMFGPVPALHTLAQLGVQEVTLHLVDKEYVEWLKMASEHPAKPSTGISTLPHAIDFESIWAEWEIRVRAVSNGLSPELVWEPHIDMVRDLVLAVAEAGQRRLSDAKAFLERFEALNASGSPEASEAHRQLKESLSRPLFPFKHGTVDQLAEQFNITHKALNGSELGELASLLQLKLLERGKPDPTLVKMRDDATTLREEYSTKLYAWIRERQERSLV